MEFLYSVFAAIALTPIAFSATLKLFTALNKASIVKGQSQNGQTVRAI